MKCPECGSTNIYTGQCGSLDVEPEGPECRDCGFDGYDAGFDDDEPDENDAERGDEAR